VLTTRQIYRASTEICCCRLAVKVLEAWTAADIIRMKDGILLERCNVIQDEATEEQSKSGNPMFGDSLPKSGL
jgi:hypothetical protein